MRVGDGSSGVMQGVETTARPQKLHPRGREEAHPRCASSGAALQAGAEGSAGGCCCDFPPPPHPLPSGTASTLCSAHAVWWVGGLRGLEKPGQCWEHCRQTEDREGVELPAELPHAHWVLGGFWTGPWCLLPKQHCLVLLSAAGGLPHPMPWALAGVPAPIPEPSSAHAEHTARLWPWLGPARSHLSPGLPLPALQPAGLPPPSLLPPQEDVCCGRSADMGGCTERAAGARPCTPTGRPGQRPFPCRSEDDNLPVGLLRCGKGSGWLAHSCRFQVLQVLQGLRHNLV